MKIPFTSVLHQIFPNNKGYINAGEKSTVRRKHLNLNIETIDCHLYLFIMRGDKS